MVKKQTMIKQLRKMRNEAILEKSAGAYIPHEVMMHIRKAYELLIDNKGIYKLQSKQQYKHARWKTVYEGPKKECMDVWAHQRDNYHHMRIVDDENIVVLKH
jgi:hypothetical protein